MPLYVGDLTVDTAHLSAAEYGGYMRLIAHYWAKQCLKQDEAMLQRICGMSEIEWKSCRPAIAEFFEIKDGKWFHKRIEEELQLADKKYEIRAAAGRKGGIRSGISRSNASFLLEAHGKQCGTNHNHNQIKKKKKKKKESLNGELRQERANQWYVSQLTAQGEAWNNHSWKTKGASQVWDKKGGWYFPTEWPPNES